MSILGKKKNYVNSTSNMELAEQLRLANVPDETLALIHNMSVKNQMPFSSTVIALLNKGVKA
jgi:hypothetical protein